MSIQKKVLVTGAAGFIGMHTVLRLLQNNYAVVGLDNINDYYAVQLKWDRLEATGIAREAVLNGNLVASTRYPSYRFLKMDLSDKPGILGLFSQEKFDYVINLAAQAGVRYSLENPYVYAESNVVGFLNILEGCREQNVKHLVYASTSSVYGLNTNTPFSEESPTEHPMSLYAATKKANEMMAHSYSHLFRIPTTGLRFFTVYGPWGRPDMALFLFTDAILNDKPIKVFNGGNMLRDFTYVDDIVEGVVRAMEKPAEADPVWNGAEPRIPTSSAPYRVFNIGNATPVKLTAYIEEIEKSLGKEAIKQMMPMQPGDVPATHADVSSLGEYVGYEPKVGIQEGVRRFTEWYKQYYGRVTSKPVDRSASQPGGR
jgi:UDP-glucuronate 4-epimerase